MSALTYTYLSNTGKNCLLIKYYFSSLWNNSLFDVRFNYEDNLIFNLADALQILND